MDNKKIQREEKRVSDTGFGKTTRCTKKKEMKKTISNKQTIPLLEKRHILLPKNQ